MERKKLESRRLDPRPPRSKLCLAPSKLCLAPFNGSSVYDTRNRKMRRLGKCDKKKWQRSLVIAEEKNELIMSCRIPIDIHKG